MYTLENLRQITSYYFPDEINVMIYNYYYNQIMREWMWEHFSNYRNVLKDIGESEEFFNIALTYPVCGPSTIFDIDLERDKKFRKMQWHK